MSGRSIILTFVLTLAVAGLTLADGAKQRDGGSSGSSGAHVRQPSSDGGGSHAKAPSGGSSSHDSSGSGSVSSGSSDDRSTASTARARSGAERRYPRPKGYGPQARGGHGGAYGGTFYRSPYYHSYYPYRRWSYYPYYGWYDGYYYGYYGWPAPYVRVSHMYETGSLRIQIEPEDTEVFVDGYYAGRVDDFNGLFQRLYLRPGRHELTFRKVGYRTHRVRLFVTAGHTLRIRYEMVLGTGAPSEAVIGAPAQEETAEDAGALDEAVSDDGAASGAPADAEPGRIELSVEPADASIYIDGAFHSQGGRHVSVGLSPGPHRIEAVRPGFRSFEQTVRVEEGRTVNLTIELVRGADRI
jgi:hypothetical protein